MATVLIVAYLLIVIAMIVVILLQRSEGGGLGMGGGGGGGFMTARGSANLLTRTTAILGALFMATAVALSIVSQVDRGSTTILDRAVQNQDGSPASVLDALNSMNRSDDLAPPVTPQPQPQAPAEDLAPPQTAPAEPAPAEGEVIAPGSSMMQMTPEAPAQNN